MWRGIALPLLAILLTNVWISPSFSQGLTMIEMGPNLCGNAEGTFSAEIGNLFSNSGFDLGNVFVAPIGGNLENCWVDVDPKPELQDSFDFNSQRIIYLSQIGAEDAMAVICIIAYPPLIDDEQYVFMILPSEEFFLDDDACLGVLDQVLSYVNKS